MEPLPDVVIGFTGANWEKLGYCPIFLARLMEMGWSYQEIKDIFTRVIGPDFAEVNCTTWIDRFEEKGIECSDYKDEPPFRIFLDRVLFIYQTTGKLMKGDFYIKDQIDAFELEEMCQDQNQSD